MIMQINFSNCLVNISWFAYLVIITFRLYPLAISSGKSNVRVLQCMSYASSFIFILGFHWKKNIFRLNVCFSSICWPIFVVFKHDFIEHCNVYMFIAFLTFIATQLECYWYCKWFIRTSCIQKSVKSCMMYNKPPSEMLDNGFLHENYWHIS